MFFLLFYMIIYNFCYLHLCLYGICTYLVHNCFVLHFLLTDSSVFASLFKAELEQAYSCVSFVYDFLKNMLTFCYLHKPGFYVYARLLSFMGYYSIFMYLIRLINFIVRFSMKTQPALA